MANDRLWLRCKHCGARRLFAKYWPNAKTFFSTWDDEHDFQIGTQWMDEHAFCNPRIGGITLHGDPMFAIVTESDKPKPSAGMLRARRRMMRRFMTRSILIRHDDTVQDTILDLQRQLTAAKRRDKLAVAEVRADYERQIGGAYVEWHKFIALAEEVLRLRARLARVLRVAAKYRADSYDVPPHRRRGEYDLWYYQRVYEWADNCLEALCCAEESRD